METYKPAVQVIQHFPEGNASVYGRWDEAVFVEAGVADVKVEVCPGVWRPRRCAYILEMATGDHWICGRGVLEKDRANPRPDASALPEVIMDLETTPSTKATAKVAPKGPRPSSEFMARYGRSPNS